MTIDDDFALSAPRVVVQVVSLSGKSESPQISTKKKKRFVKRILTNVTDALTEASFRKVSSHDGAPSIISSDDVIAACHHDLRAVKGTVEEYGMIRKCLDLADLEANKQSVQDLGNEIRERIIVLFEPAFDSATNGNLDKLLFLVEAIELYEKNWNDGSDTSVKSEVKELIFQFYEFRGLYKFREIACDDFLAILHTATDLVADIETVEQISHCFSPDWRIGNIWCSCVVHVITAQILHHVGGHCQDLSVLSLTQLLDLVSWIEGCYELIVDEFPQLTTMLSPQFDDCTTDSQYVRISSRQGQRESLAWVNFWELYRLTQEEFLVRTRSQTDEWLDKIYGSEAIKRQSVEGTLTTSLCEDVISVFSVHLHTLKEKLSTNSNTLVLAVCIILSHMRSKQMHARDAIIQDMEMACAASNDFTRMSEKTEVLVAELMSECDFTEDMITMLETTSYDLIRLYSSDALFAARSVHIFVFKSIEEGIGARLFDEEWEGASSPNLAISLVRTLEDFHEDLVQYMDDFMVVKSMMSFMSATVIFYAKHLLQRAKIHRGNTQPYFSDVKTALRRMSDDIIVLREYFEGLATQMPSLKKNIDKDFEILTTIHEILSIASGLSMSEPSDFILVLHKHVRDVVLTKQIVVDLWRLIDPWKELHVLQLVELNNNLRMIAPDDDAITLEANNRANVKGLCFIDMVFELYAAKADNVGGLQSISLSSGTPCEHQFGRHPRETDFIPDLIAACNKFVGLS